MSEVVFNPYKKSDSNKAFAFKKEVGSDLTNLKPQNNFAFAIFRKKSTKTVQSFTGEAMDNPPPEKKHSVLRSSNASLNGSLADVRGNSAKMNRQIGTQIVMNPVTSLFTSLASVSKQVASSNHSRDNSRLKTSGTLPTESNLGILDKIDLDKRMAAIQPKGEKRVSTLQSILNFKEKLHKPADVFHKKSQSMAGIVGIEGMDPKLTKEEKPFNLLIGNNSQQGAYLNLKQSFDNNPMKSTKFSVMVDSKHKLKSR